jgi:small-conductance mechanosensitive channel
MLAGLAKFLQTEFDLGKISSSVTAVLITILVTIIFFIFCYFAWRFLQKLNNHIFRKIEEEKGRSMSRDFLEKLISFAITVFFVVIPFNWDDIGQSVLGSATVIAAVLGFAAQDVIKDILAGVQISIYKPFDIGDRIELENGTAGIVENITMRHVVIKRIDTLRVVIPNSKMNDYSVVNYSYDVPRSALFNFPVGYQSDVRKAKQVIAQAIKDSPYSIPGKLMKDGTMDYAPVYFIDVGASALIMSVTVYFDHGTATEVLKDDVNTAVFEALAANGIEIPYSYTNVILQNGGQPSKI